MSYWSSNPELLEEITTKALPEEWRNKVENEEIDLYDIPEDIFYKAMLKGEREYWTRLAERHHKPSVKNREFWAGADKTYDEERDCRAGMNDEANERKEK